ncbi:hypothetical protein G6F65_020279 [Rhizopus arrhizus]|nr:hypothetical protein G6F65_020279 [Rhizopus arrhizus]
MSAVMSLVRRSRSYPDTLSAAVHDAFKDLVLRHFLNGDVYDWAEALRTVDISKGSTRFASHEQIASYAPQITRPLARDHRLQGLSPDSFRDRAGHYLGELNVLHPFREGSGCSIREFIGQLGREAGYGIDWQGRVDCLAAKP